jgi:hypothetical protein
VLPDFAQRHVYLHFHGRGGPDREDADLKARILAQDKLAGLDRFVHVFVWREWLEAAGTERISFTGQAIGRQVGQQLARRGSELRSLHVSGTSAGGFAANECVTAYVAAAGAKRASTRLSLCDPFCARADEVGAPWDDGSRTSGAKLFGRDADFAEHYLNTDDVVPSTNVRRRGLEYRGPRVSVRPIDARGVHTHTRTVPSAQVLRVRRHGLARARGLPAAQLGQLPAGSGTPAARLPQLADWLPRPPLRDEARRQRRPGGAEP